MVDEKKIYQHYNNEKEAREAFEVLKKFYTYENVTLNLLKDDEIIESFTLMNFEEDYYFHTFTV